MRIILIDNYDSFTYNICHLITAITHERPTVVRNDSFDIHMIDTYDKIIISPGPGLPSDAGKINEVIWRFGRNKHILGICLGHQAIGEVYGAQLKQLDAPYHGVSSLIHCDPTDAIFSKLPPIVEVGRYHSWVVDKNKLPSELEVIAHDNDGSIMAIKHKIHNVRGIQFHPESVLTPTGKTILSNWISMS